MTIKELSKGNETKENGKMQGTENYYREIMQLTEKSCPTSRTNHGQEN